MNTEEFLKEKDLLLNSIENNTKEHWENYYKGVPIECIYDDLVIDINEIKRLTEENQKLKADYGNIAQVERDLLLEENQKYKEVIDKAIKYINDNLIISSILGGKKYYTINDYSFDYRELLDILKEVK